jgi:hypothetical protein
MPARLSNSAVDGPALPAPNSAAPLCTGSGCWKHLVGVQEVEAPRDVEGDAVAQAVPQQPAARVRLYGAVQVAACSDDNSVPCPGPGA